MKPNNPIATRWRDANSQTGDHAPTVGEWFAELQNFGEPSDFAVLRLRERLAASQLSEKRSRWLPRLAFSLCGLLLASTASAVVWQRLHHVPSAAISSPIDSATAQPLPIVVFQLPQEAPHEQPAALKIHRRTASLSVDSLTRETELLSQALSRLRQGNDPKGALQILDVYGKTFPNGVLTAEAKTARVDALLALGRKPQALALLMRFDLSTWPRGGELRLLRAELLADKGDCVSALKEFAAVLANTKVLTVRARAERGQARCITTPN